MKVTRDVVNDLLPLYLADEASDDTRQLVEEFLRNDPELDGRIRRARIAVDTLHGAPSAGKDLELKTLHRTRRMLSLKSLVLGAAIFTSLVPFSVSHDARGVRWLLVESPWMALLSVAVAVALWGVYWNLRRSARAAGF